jgi:hypothetical protein
MDIFRTPDERREHPAGYDFEPSCIRPQIGEAMLEALGELSG